MSIVDAVRWKVQLAKVHLNTYMARRSTERLDHCQHLLLACFLMALHNQTQPVIPLGIYMLLPHITLYRDA